MAWLSACRLCSSPGDVDRETVTEILTTLACALVDEGWYGEAVDHSHGRFRDWPTITRALRIARGD